MKKCFAAIAAFTLLISIPTFGQIKGHLIQKYRQQQSSSTTVAPKIELPPNFIVKRRGLPQTANFKMQPLSPIVRPAVDHGDLKMIRCDNTKLPIFIKGQARSQKIALRQALTVHQQGMAYINPIRDLLKINNPDQEFEVLKVNQRPGREQHVRLQQYYNGIEVYGGEMILHYQRGSIASMSSRHFPTPEIEHTNPTLSAEDASNIAYKDVARTEKIVPLAINLRQMMPEMADQSKLVIYHKQLNLESEKLAWQLDIIPNVAARWRYFIDAHTGEVIHKINQICQLHNHGKRHEKKHAPMKESEEFMGPATARATDLFGNSVNVDTYEEQNRFWLINGSKPMFNAARSVFPNNTVGTIITIDAQNGDPRSDDFEPVFITSPNNEWDFPAAVSAHNNAEIAYDYYRNTFQRNSINGRGGNIFSFVDVDEPDNAFWNGFGMYYGTGDQAFNGSLAASLDVAGHEITHGVIQSEANLEYVSQSGAMNESMADIFGTMMDREDWRIGEDVVRSNVYRSGALRDLSNPNNGVSRGRPGWQPAHMDEFLNLPETEDGDFGGVHINSGITNRAFFLFASNIGLDRAEQVYYDALVDGLTRNSQFIDLRIAIIEAATNRYGNNVAQAAAQAFDQVGILEGEATDVIIDIEENTGDDFVLYSTGNKVELKVFSPSGIISGTTTLANEGLESRHSITDDGSLLVYVAADKTLRFIQFDWDRLEFGQGSLSDEPVWRNAAISKDGARLAALTDEVDNTILVFDLERQGTPNQSFTLFNPTFSEGVATGDVAFADILEWDFSGEFIMYDAFNEIETLGGQIDYWDIGFIRVWDNNINDFADGRFIQKLFSGLPENTSVGNPTFSKNSPAIIAFDFVEQGDFSENYSLRSANIQTGDQGVLRESNFDLHFPSFSTDDQQIIFDAITTGSERVLASLGLSEDKLSAATAASIFHQDPDEALWGIWFAAGQRILTSTKEVNLGPYKINIYPNPFYETLQVSVTGNDQEPIMADWINSLGQIVKRQSLQANQNEQLTLEGVPSGTYILRIKAGGLQHSQKVMKLE